jgi:hypothetical protein
VEIYQTSNGVIKPEKDFEGVNEPVGKSRFGATYDFVHQLRDPSIYEEDGRIYLLYSSLPVNGRFLLLNYPLKNEIFDSRTAGNII